MRRWLIVILSIVAVLALLYSGYAIFVSYDNGTHVNVTIHAGAYKSGEKAGKMYYHCTGISGAGASCDGADQTTVNVHKRDKVTFTVISDDGPGSTHDFKLEGLAYSIYPAGVEMELEDGNQAGTFTAWAGGDYEFICELSGHEDAGMHGTLHVI
jgi:uncharacterized cupredoxin-like copper-binding protein